MSDLIERLEKAAGPDRELDIAIWRRFVRPDAPPGRVPFPWDYCYTSSIDAAMTLVPAEYECAVARRCFGGRFDIPPGGSADVFSRDCELWSAQAATPALALCIAALRARAALTPEPR